LGIDELSAPNADIRVLLSNLTGPYAVCFLEFKEIETQIEDGVSETEAIYKVDVRRKLGKAGSYRIQEVHGTCDIDPTTTDVIETGVPAVQAGDGVTAVLVSGIIQTEFLEGTFEND
jgi:hypothetical protein